jgi:hypothetical protein
MEFITAVKCFMIQAPEVNTFIVWAVQLILVAP